MCQDSERTATGTIGHIQTEIPFREMRELMLVGGEIPHFLCPYSL